MYLDLSDTFFLSLPLVSASGSMKLDWPVYYDANMWEKKDCYIPSDIKMLFPFLGMEFYSLENVHDHHCFHLEN